MRITWQELLAGALVVVLAGCGCEATIKSELPDAVKNNDQSLAEAFARERLVRVQLKEQNAMAQAELFAAVAEPTVVKSTLVLPPSHEAPLVARDEAGKVHVITVQHDVATTRHHRPCGCGPNAGGGTAPPPPPIWYVELDSPDAFGPPRTIVARNWIEVENTYPEASDKKCSEIP